MPLYTVDVVHNQIGVSPCLSLTNIYIYSKERKDSYNLGELIKWKSLGVWAHNSKRVEEHSSREFVLDEPIKFCQIAKTYNNHNSSVLYNKTLS